MKDAALNHLGIDPIGMLDEATDIERSDTMAGQMTAGVSQFLTGYGVAGKTLQLSKAATTTGQIARATTQGALADFSAFDPMKSASPISCGKTSDCKTRSKSSSPLMKATRCLRAA